MLKDDYLLITLPQPEALPWWVGSSDVRWSKIQRAVLVGLGEKGLMFKKKYYLVVHGGRVLIYSTFQLCEIQIMQKNAAVSVIVNTNNIFNSVKALRQDIVSLYLQKYTTLFVFNKQLNSITQQIHPEMGHFWRKCREMQIDCIYIICKQNNILNLCKFNLLASFMLIIQSTSTICLPFCDFSLGIDCALSRWSRIYSISPPRFRNRRGSVFVDMATLKN